MPGISPKIATPTSSVQGLGHTPPLLSAPARNVEKCTSPNCSRLRNRLCTLKMCKKCCTSRPAGCGIPSHSLAKLPPKPPIFTLPSDITPLPIDCGWDALDVLRNENPTVKLFRAEEERKKVEVYERQVEEEREYEEDAIFATSLTSSTSPPPMFTSSNSAGLLPFPLTPSRSAPCLAPTISPLPAVSQTVKKLPTITNHLDSNWRRAHNDRSKEAQTRKHKAQGDPAVIQKFFIMFWAQVCCCFFVA